MLSKNSLVKTSQLIYLTLTLAQLRALSTFCHQVFSRWLWLAKVSLTLTFLVTNCSYLRNNLFLVAISCGPTGPKTTLPRVFFFSFSFHEKALSKPPSAFLKQGFSFWMSNLKKSCAVLHLVHVKFLWRKSYLWCC